METRNTRKYKTRVKWTDRAELILLEMWEAKIQQLRGNRKNRQVYFEIAAVLQKNGFPFSGLDVKSKVHNMTARYRREKLLAGQSGASPSQWPLYTRVHGLIGSYRYYNFPETPSDSILVQNSASIEASGESSSCDSVEEKCGNFFEIETMGSYEFASTSIPKFEPSTLAAASTSTTPAEPSTAAFQQIFNETITTSDKMDEDIDNMDEMDSMKKRKYKTRVPWTETAERILLRMWEDNILNLRANKNNGQVYKAMAMELQKNGFPFTRQDVKSKVHNMTSRYRKEKQLVVESGGSPSRWPFFTRIHDLVELYKHKSSGSIFVQNAASMEASEDSSSYDSVEENCGNFFEIETMGSDEPGQFTATTAPAPSATSIPVSEASTSAPIPEPSLLAGTSTPTPTTSTQPSTSVFQQIFNGITTTSDQIDKPIDNIDERDTTKKRKKYKTRLLWTKTAENILLGMWEDNILRLRAIRNNGEVYEAMAQELQYNGFPFSKEDVQSKVHNMTTRYRREKKLVVESGGSPSEWPHYTRVHGVVESYKYKISEVTSDGILVQNAASLEASADSSSYDSVEDKCKNFFEIETTGCEEFASSRPFTLTTVPAPLSISTTAPDPLSTSIPISGASTSAPIPEPTIPTPISKPPTLPAASTSTRTTSKQPVEPSSSVHQLILNEIIKISDKLDKQFEKFNEMDTKMYNMLTKQVDSLEKLADKQSAVMDAALDYFQRTKQTEEEQHLKDFKEMFFK